MKEGGADAERKGKLKVEDLKINTVFNMHCEQKKNIKERTRNVTHQRVQGNSQEPQPQSATSPSARNTDNNIVKKNTTIQQDTKYLLDQDFNIVSYR